MLPVLRKGDGFRRNTPHLMGDVRRLQKRLRKAGFDAGADGLFGSGTEGAVKAFQRSKGLAADGVVGPASWAALDPAQTQKALAEHADVPGFESFHGDLGWVHRREGHAGTAYWPGGRSGVTLDPGYDMGHHEIPETQTLYGGLITADQYRTLREVVGITGTDARDALATRPSLETIKISRPKALGVMPHVAVPYWTAVARRFGALVGTETPGSVQTALLSLAYNRGARNKGMDVLAEPLREGSWLAVADEIGQMQQDHRLRGIRKRRRMEAELIRDQVQLG